ncbi:Hpt domain-containing protein [Endozoicomonas sp. SCSIO W0465]|uniref:Hpt domain-containing protein n=1 Tax=Endozoicomonas sp. SCSIO W0465 TaxID=2918516 RepID=UPI00207554E3|nr:Hpt domain-containing protein [Endozoicomonas sp. SCSIO W0465]USE35258.1 Hpt domain-containing protein [Endozoicomonas sp. SCSIO W0465]
MINLENLHQITDGDEVLLEELLSTFFQSTREDILNLKAAVNNQQTALIVNFAHRIKGGAAVVGAEHLVTLAGDLEQSGQQMEPERYDPLFLQLQDTFNRIEALHPNL